MTSQPKPASYKVGVKADRDTEWVYNGLRFASREAADEWGFGLSMRWTAVREYEVHESSDEPNR